MAYVYPEPTTTSKSSESSKPLKSSLLHLHHYQHPSWGEKYPEPGVKLQNIPYDVSYQPFFNRTDIQQQLEKLNRFFDRCLKEIPTVKLFPYPDLIFNALVMTPLDQIKVVILGQDPYHQFSRFENQVVPQAMGLSFSVPVGVKTPSSLRNIYRNQIDHDDICWTPNHGNLTCWAHQGCLMLNTSLTVQHGYAGCHLKRWKYFTDELIKFVSDERKDIIFLLWGGSAIDKEILIDTDKHLVLKSSHPSGLSFNNQCRGNPSFRDADHFSQVNKVLKKRGETPIVWQLGTIDEPKPVSK